MITMFRSGLWISRSKTFLWRFCLKATSSTANSTSVWMQTLHFIVFWTRIRWGGSTNTFQFQQSLGFLAEIFWKHLHIIFYLWFLKLMRANLYHRFLKFSVLFWAFLASDWVNFRNLQLHSFILFLQLCYFIKLLF